MNLAKIGRGIIIAALALASLILIIGMAASQPSGVTPTPSTSQMP